MGACGSSRSVVGPCAALGVRLLPLPTASGVHPKHFGQNGAGSRRITGYCLLDGALLGVAAQDGAAHSSLSIHLMGPRWTHQHYPVASERCAAHLVLPRWHDFLTTFSQAENRCNGKGSCREYWCHERATQI